MRTFELPKDTLVVILCTLCVVRWDLLLPCRHETDKLSVCIIVSVVPALCLGVAFAKGNQSVLRACHHLLKLGKAGGLDGKVLGFRQWHSRTLPCPLPQIVQR